MFDRYKVLAETGLAQNWYEYLKNKKYCDFLTVEQIAKLAQAENTLSSWKESDSEWITTFNYAMKDSPVKVTRFGAYTRVVVDVEFPTPPEWADYIHINGRYPESDKTFKELTFEGLNTWTGQYHAQTDETELVYDRFGAYPSINVQLFITETSHDGLPIYLFDNQAGRLNNIAASGNNVPVTHNALSSWSVDNKTDIHMYPIRYDSTVNENGDRVYRQEAPYGEEHFDNVIAHEFGHVLGIGDAYLGEHGARRSEESPIEKF